MLATFIVVEMRPVLMVAALMTTAVVMVTTTIAM